MFLKMIFFRVLILMLLNLKYCLANEDIGCDSLEMFQEIENEELELDEFGDIAIFSDVKIISLLSKSNYMFDKLYIDARLDRAHGRVDLTIFTTESFKNYSREQNSTSILLKIEFKCSEGWRTLLFSQTLKEGNYFAPEFSQDEYIFVIPTPLYKGYTFTTVQEISAVDYDLWDYDITFSSIDLEDPRILVQTSKKHEMKNSFVVLELKSAILSLSTDIEFSIIGRDSGYPPKSSAPARIIIKADRLNSLPPIPKFINTVVYDSLTSDLQLPRLQIELDASTYSTDVSFKKFSDEENIFQIKNVKNVVFVTLAKQLDRKFLNSRERLTFEIEASNSRLKESGRIAVFISIPQRRALQFKSALYTGNIIAKSNSLEISEFELLDNDNELELLDIELQGDESELFDFEINENKIELFIKPTSKASAWTNIKYVSLTLLVETDLKENALTNIIIDVFHMKLFFQKPTYSGSINNYDDLNLEAIVLLSNGPSIDDVDIKLLQPDAKLFSFSRLKNEIEFTLRESNDNELRSKRYLRFEVEAMENSTGVKANCLIFIDILKEAFPFKFKSDLYKGTLIAKSNILVIDDFEVLPNTHESTQLVTELQGEKSDLFDVVFDGNFIQLLTKSGLNLTVWKNVKYVSLRLFVKTDSEETASTNIIIDVVHTTLLFQKPVYSGWIDIDGELNLDHIILLTNLDAIDDINIKLLQSDAKLFSFTIVKNQIVIALQEDDVNDHGSQTYLRFEVEAMEPSTGIAANCLVFVEILNDKTPFQFKNDLYRGKLFASSNTLEIEDFELIVNENNLFQLDAEVQGDEAALFILKQNSNLIKLLINSSLNATVWTNIKYISLRLLAKTDLDETASTNIIIDVVHTIILFKNSTYLGSIDNNAELSLDPVILLTDSDTIDEININLLQVDAGLFSFTRDKNQIIIGLKENNENELRKKRYITFEVEAIEPKTGIKANCIILIDIIRDLTPLQFESDFYKGKLIAKSSELDFGDVKLLVNEHELPHLDLDLRGDKADFFGIELHHNLISLLLKSDLNASQWTNDKYVSLRLLAKIDSEQIALTSIIIDVVHTTMLFEKPAYSGSIDNDNRLTLGPLVLFSNSDTIDDFDIELVQSDAELFSFKKVENQVVIGLKDINEDELRSKRHLKFGVEARESTTGVEASCFIFIEILKEIIPLHFKAVVYTGKLSLKPSSLEIEDMELIVDEHELQQLNIELQGDDADSFDIDINKNIIKLFIKTATNTTSWINRKYISLTLSAKIDSEKTAITNIIIDIIPMILRFEKPAYSGLINNDDELILHPITLLTNIETIGDINVQLLQTDAELFTFKRVDNQILIALRDYTTNEIQGKKYFRFEIEAKEPSTGLRATCIVFIDIIKDIMPLQFKASVYKGKLVAKSVSLQIEEFEVVANENELKHMDVDLQGHKAELFGINQKENIIKLFPNPNSTASEWANINYISLRLLAKTDANETALTNIVIDVIHTILSFQKAVYTGTINSDNELTLDEVYLLTNSDTTDDVDIQLLQIDAELFSFTRTDNKIIIVLQENINHDYLWNRSYLKFEVEAKEAATGVNASSLVLVELIKDTTRIAFEDRIYEGQITKDVKLILKDIILADGSYKPEVEFYLRGKDAQYFKFQRSENILSLSLNENFNLSEHIDSNTLWVELKAVNLKADQETTAVIIIDILHEIVPEFEKPNYIADITQANILNIEKPILKLSTWRTYTSFELQGNYSDLFECENIGNEIVISIKPDMLVLKETKSLGSIVLVIVASNSGVQGYATIVIFMPQSAGLSNIFRKAIQNGKIEEGDHKQVLNINEIELVSDHNVGDFTCQLSGGESEHFEYTAIVPKNVIKLIIARELSDEIIVSTFYITFLLECKKKQDESVAGSTIIFIDLPGRQLICPTVEPPTFIPEFESPLYNFFAKPTYVGSLQFVSANIKGSDAEIRYSLYIENEHLRSRIGTNTKSGEIFVRSIISPGTYYFDIIAENSVTLGRSLAKGRLDVEALIQCEDHVSVSNSLIVKYLEEETRHEEILKVKFENCEFYIFSIEPSYREYVKINHATKMLTMIPMDREDAVFSNMIKPKIEIKLKLECSVRRAIMRRNQLISVARVKRNSKISDNITESNSLALADDIPFSKDITMLSIMLVDINDNSPEFVYPRKERLVVGFPDAKISANFFSEDLIQIVANDKDEGLNGKIKYSIQSNDHFFVDQYTGKMYPYANAMERIKELQLTVYAKDRNGAADGLNASFTMVIKVLSAEHFILLTFINKNIKKLEDLLDDVRVSSGINLMSIKHAVISLNDKSLSSAEVGTSRAGEVQFVQKVWAYSFEGDIPILSKVMKRKLSHGEGISNISIQTFEEALITAEKYTEEGHLYSSTGYIVGLCVLAIIIVACIGYFFWRYIRKINHHTHNNSANTLSAVGSKNQNFNKQAAEADVQRQSDILSDTLYEPSFLSKGDSVKISGTTRQDSTDDGRRLQIEKLRSMLNGALRDDEEESESDSSSGSHQPRATVKFNEFVERIHIESDDDEKPKIR